MIPVSEDPKLDTQNNVVCDHQCFDKETGEKCRYWQQFIGKTEVRQGIIRWNCCFYEVDGVQI